MRTNILLIECYVTFPKSISIVINKSTLINALLHSLTGSNFKWCDLIYIVRLKIIKIKNHEMEWTLPASSPIQSHIESLFVLTCACMVHFFYECLV